MDKVDKFMEGLTIFISSKKYIDIMKTIHKVDMVEYRNTNPCSMISPDLIKSVFVEYESYLCNDFQCDFPEIWSENAELKEKSYIMSLTIILFNNSEYCDGDYTKYLKRMAKKYHNFLKVRYGCDCCKSECDANQYSNPIERASFPGLTRFFFLLYELKFIYGDINSHFSTFHLDPYHQP
ncbi:hypothetical protein RF11_09776 [Thelohanellus kitauei]|uniref:Uncharacterized protein n=1 Tax=Thelohanellus kitauei TaxID=669202 RepID=A0A0C2IHL1_THEKT|nr:hypothetical protein RF11_09776 [Thelohanellus kitauei]